MNDREAFMAAILERPGDNLVRKVFADWLEEHGGEPERAEFIRLQIEIAERLPGGIHWDSAKELRRRESELFQDHKDIWFPGNFELTINREWFEDPEHFGDVTSQTPVGLVECGFISEFRAPVEWMLGGESCGTCNGYGHHHRNDSYSAAFVRSIAPNLICRICGGAGWFLVGYLPELLQQHPLTYVQPTNDEVVMLSYRFWSVDGHDVPDNSKPEERWIVRDRYHRLDPALQIGFFDSRQNALRAVSNEILNEARRVFTTFSTTYLEHPSARRDTAR